MPAASLSRWTLVYFAASLSMLMAAEALAIAGIGYPSAGLREPATLIVVHLVAIGWLSLAMAGALLQFVPVLVSRPLVGGGLALPALVSMLSGLLLLCVGFAVLAGWLELSLDILPLAAIALAVGFATLVVILARTIAQELPIAPFALFVVIGLVCVTVTVLSGSSFAFALAGRAVWLAEAGLLPDGVAFHAMLGFGGWLGIIAFGVSYRLFAMFMMAPEPPSGRLLPVLVLCALAPALAAAGFVVLVAGFRTEAVAGGALAVFALTTGVYGRDMVALFGKRRRRALEPNMLASLPALAALGFGAVLLPFVVAFGAGEHLVAAVSFLLVFGWLSGLTLAQLVKIVPFMTWLEVYAPRLGRMPAPRVGDLLAVPRSRIWFVSYFGGVAAGTLALAVGLPPGFRGAMLLCLVGTVGIAVELMRVRRLAEVEASYRPAMEDRPRIFLLRTEDRSDAHDRFRSISS